LRKSLQTDRRTDRQTDDGRLAIVLANELKIRKLRLLIDMTRNATTGTNNEIMHGNDDLL